MKWDDLLSVKYKPNGRTKAGLDCWGLVLECCRRNGTPLEELEYSGGMNESELTNVTWNLNVVEVPYEERRQGDIMECTYGGRLHSGFLVEKDKVLHATVTGVRLSPITAFNDIKIFRGKTW